MRCMLCRVMLIRMQGSMVLQGFTTRQDRIGARGLPYLAVCDGHALLSARCGALQRRCMHVQACAVGLLHLQAQVRALQAWPDSGTGCVWSSWRSSWQSSFLAHSYSLICSAQHMRKV